MVRAFSLNLYNVYACKLPIRTALLFRINDEENSVLVSEYIRKVSWMM